MRAPLRTILPAQLMAVVSLLYTLPVDAADDAYTVDFAQEVLPILSDKCFVCHGPDADGAESLRLDTFASATADRGGYRAIDPDRPEHSVLLERIHSTDDPMPPADADKQLTAAERDLLSLWVRQGGTYARHWAFVPPRRQPPPGNPDAGGSAAIDAFVRSRLAERGVDVAPRADRGTLARRTALVLTGLPPDPGRLAEFLADDREDAYDRLVGDLLASERFGEHQARYWLDAVRYGDTHGLHLDNRRGIFPYRDWVVMALNQNLPLDQFLTWQLAGDLLPNPTLAQRVATGFVRMNPSTSEGGAIPEEFQAKNNFDRTETLGTVLLGVSLTCARCHSHKYDPITQTEYYRLLAFFNSTAESAMDGNKYVYGPVVKAPADQAAWREWEAYEAERDRLIAKASQAVGNLAGPPDKLAPAWHRADPAERWRMLTEPDGPFAAWDLQPSARELAVRMATAEEAFTTTLVAQDLPQRRTTRVLRRGEYNLPTGEPLEPGILSAMGPFPEQAPRNRLGLAQWLTSPDHPLVARVLINRIWQRTFGHGLVRTPEDFGVQGKQPAHPQLLDWLAVELRESGWDLKHMLRMMVTSRTFQQQSRWRDDLDDPENVWLGRGPSHRLDAEVLRDVALWASGLLDPHMGGEGVKPYQPAGMWKAMAHPASNTKQYERDSGQRLYRRSLYVYWKRTSPHPMMTLFDAPDRESSCVRRSRTNTSLQSLGLLNETQRIEMARAFGGRLLRDRSTDADRLQMAFRLLACRGPTESERAACAALLQRMRGRYAASREDALALLAIGELPRDKKLDPAEHAAWTQVAATLLATDLAIMLY